MAIGNAALNKNVDFTSDSLDTGPVSVNSFENSVETNKPVPVSTTSPTKANVKTDPANNNSVKQSGDVIATEDKKAASPKKFDVDQLKNAVMSLNELKPGLKYECGEIGQNPDNAKKFRTTVTVDGKQFEGFGTSKKLSKAACARACLYKLYGVHFTPETNTRHVITQERTAGDTNIPVSRFCMDQVNRF